MYKTLSSDTIQKYTFFDYLFVISVSLYSCLCCLLYALNGSAIIDTLIMIFFLFTVLNSSVKYKLKFRFHSFEKRLAILLLFVFIAFLSLMSITNNVGFYKDYLRGGVICFLFVLLGGDFRIEDKVFNRILWGFSITAIVVAFYFIFFNIGGVVIDTSYGREIGKNSYGPILCYVFTIMLFETMHNKVFIIKSIALGICVFSFIAISVLRARTSMVVCLLILSLFLFKLLRKNTLKILLYTFFFLIVIYLLDGILGFNLINKTFSFVGDAFTVGHENDFTSGREVRNDEAISIIKENLLWGNIGINVQVEWVHNFVLYVLSSWGLFIGSPLILLYLYLWFYVTKSVFSVSFELNNIGYYLMLVPLITSLSESSFPLYPGTTLFIAYFSLGFAVKKKLNRTI